MAKQDRPQPLKSERIQKALQTVPAWRQKGDAITRTFTLPSFRAALAFVQFIGELAEAHNHHPDIDIRYSRVTLKLSTHSAGGLTDKDFELARLVDGSS